ncbi:MAG: 50S ribosomal protein L18 [Capsulimonadales bacterium]|nr:50S ribosomal protein L18 [Capsulimonadales bacterium]
MKINRNEIRQKRHVRVRKRVFGTEERPRLNVYRSHQHIYAQVINDEIGHTLAAASSADPSLKNAIKGCNIAGAQAVGKLIAERATAAGVSKVVYDRGGYLYHGRIQALAEAAREGGLDF